MYLISIDAEKAFDQLWRKGLFHKLKDKLVYQDWILLKRYYDESKSIITYNNETSNTFDITSGVKQGGILSPFLFNMYVNDLIEECVKLNNGAKMGSENVSIISYCDDINLISSSIKHAQILLNVCENYGRQWKLKFNIKKTNFMSFGNVQIKHPKFLFNNEFIEEKQSMKILGYLFTKKYYDSSDHLKMKFEKVRKSFFTLNKFGMRPDGLNIFLQSFIYKTYCLSQMTYCLEIMSINNKTISDLDIMQNSLIRYLLNLSRYSHISIIKSILKIANFKHLILRYKLNFLKQIQHHKLTKHILEYSLENMNNIKCYAHQIKDAAGILELDIETILKDNRKTIDTLNKKFEIDEDLGLKDSIKFCLNKKNDLHYKTLLVLLTTNIKT